jgi:chromosome partitioning protein
MQAGERVALFDLDPQGSLEAWGNSRTQEEPHVEAFPVDKLAQLPAMMKALGAHGITLAIIDTPGADNTATHKAMEAADMCLVPLRPTRLDATAMLPTVRALMRGETPFAFVLNQCPTTPRNTRAAEVSAGLATLGYSAEPNIGQRADFQDAYAAGQGVTEFAPNSKAAEEIRQLWAWVAKKMKGAKS